MTGRHFSSWDSYFWEPGGPVLRNLYGERDGAALARREYAETAAQQFDIDRGAVRIARTYDASHVRAIHRQMFANVYEWAGEYRTVGIQKGLSQFADPSQIPRYLTEAHRLVQAGAWSTMDREQFAHATAEVFAYINQAHPFREGNGRTAKLFMQHLAELSSWRIEYSPQVCGVTPEIWNQASMLSGPDRGQHEPVPDSLVPVFYAMAQPRSTTPPPAPEFDVRDVVRVNYPQAAGEAARQEQRQPGGPRRLGRGHGAGGRGQGQGYGR